MSHIYEADTYNSDKYVLQPIHASVMITILLLLEREDYWYMEVR